MSPDSRDPTAISAPSRRPPARPFPRMANFSFDFGNGHWTVLDANPYVDWTNRELQAWVARHRGLPRRSLAIRRAPPAGFQFGQEARG